MNRCESGPVNLNPDLLCEGSCAPWPAHHPHTYVKRIKRDSQADLSLAGAIYDFVFSCDTCHTHRRFGCEEFA